LLHSKQISEIAELIYLEIKRSPTQRYNMKFQYYMRHTLSNKTNNPHIEKRYDRARRARVLPEGVLGNGGVNKNGSGKGKDKGNQKSYDKSQVKKICPSSEKKEMRKVRSLGIGRNRFTLVRSDPPNQIQASNDDNPMSFWPFNNCCAKTSTNDQSLFTQKGTTPVTTSGQNYQTNNIDKDHSSMTTEPLNCSVKTPKRKTSKRRKITVKMQPIQETQSVATTSQNHQTSNSDKDDSSRTTIPLNSSEPMPKQSKPAVRKQPLQITTDVPAPSQGPQTDNANEDDSPMSIWPFNLFTTTPTAHKYSHSAKSSPYMNQSNNTVQEQPKPIYNTVSVV
jgi:hypothetical protein